MKSAMITNHLTKSLPLYASFIFQLKIQLKQFSYIYVKSLQR